MIKHIQIGFKKSILFTMKNYKFTALFTKLPAGGCTMLRGAFKLTAPFTAMGIFRNNTRQTLERLGSREALGSVNSAVRLWKPSRD